MKGGGARPARACMDDQAAVDREAFRWVPPQQARRGEQGHSPLRRGRFGRTLLAIGTGTLGTQSSHHLQMWGRQWGWVLNMRT